jgi:ATP-dependent RNA helicase DeaD
MLAAIEKATRQSVELLELPSTERVNNKRIADFKQRISDTLAAGELAFMRNLLEQYQQEHDTPALDIAAALARLAMGDRPLLLEPDRVSTAGKPAARQPHADEHRPRRSKADRLQDAESERFRLEVGHQHGVKPGNIVGAIANEAGLDSQHIGRIEINDTFSLIDLPAGMPRDIFNDLKKVRVCGQPLNISRLDGDEQSAKGRSHPPPKVRHDGKSSARQKTRGAGKKSKGKPNAGLAARGDKAHGKSSGKSFGRPSGRSSTKKRD